MRAMLSPLFALLLTLPALAAATDADEYAARRAEVMRRIGPDAMLILRSPPAQVRNGDVDWPFRQEDSLLYLTGLDNPDTTLVLVPGDEAHREIVFTLDSDPAAELWTGRIPSFDEVSKRSGVTEVVSETSVTGSAELAEAGKGMGTGVNPCEAGPANVITWLAFCTVSVRVWVAAVCGLTGDGSEAVTFKG